MEATGKIDIKNQLLDLYNNNKSILNGHNKNKISSERKKAVRIFEEKGIPTRKNEAYKYTSLQSLFEKQYDTEFSDIKFKVDINEIFKCEVPELDTHVVLVLNGFYYHDNQFTGLPEGIVIASLAEASVKYPELFNKHYAKYAVPSQDSLAALNTMFAQDGIFMYIPENVQLEKPVQIINLGYSFTNLRINRRNLIIAEKNTSAKIIVCDHTLTERSFLTNALTEVYAGENAHIDYTRLQNENNLSSQLSNLYIHQMKNSNVSSNALTLHGGFVRNNVFITLNGEGAENNSYGLYLCDDKQHVSSYTYINHAVPKCTSNQLYKGILDNFATGAFNGMIYVNKDAQKTVAYQRNQNILLTPTAKMNTKPQLEIYADDVKCSHGATVGQLDKDALFYLRSRGINEPESRHLLMYAFTNEIISKIKTEHLRSRINELVEKRLRGELSRCQNCEIRCG